MKKRFGMAALAAAGLALLASSVSASDTKAQVVEEIIARVNNDIITLSDYEKAEAALQEEVQQDCQGCPQEKLDALYQARAKNLLRDLIDQSLLVQRAKDMGINVDTDVVKQLDQIRQQNNLPSIDALEKAVESQGLSWEDYKQNLADRLLTQRVIQQEVGSHLSVGTDEVQKYYDAHKGEFVRPEEVFLSEIFFNTKGKSPQEAADARKKAEGILARLKKGESFSALAKRYSQGPTAKDGGSLGAFKRGELNPEIEKAVFPLNKGDITGVIQTPNGFEILHVNQHYQAGLQPLDKVEDEIMNKLYSQKIEPAMRDYLEKLRQDSYVVVKPGYVDSAAVGGNTVIQEVSPSQDKGRGKKSKKRRKHG